MNIMNISDLGCCVVKVNAGEKDVKNIKWSRRREDDLDQDTKTTGGADLISRAEE